MGSERKILGFFLLTAPENTVGKLPSEGGARTGTGPKQGLAASVKKRFLAREVKKNRESISKQGSLKGEIAPGEGQKKKRSSGGKGSIVSQMGEGKQEAGNAAGLRHNEPCCSPRGEPKKTQRRVRTAAGWRARTQNEGVYVQEVP